MKCSCLESRAHSGGAGSEDKALSIHRHYVSPGSGSIQSVICTVTLAKGLCPQTLTSPLGCGSWGSSGQDGSCFRHFLLTSAHPRAPAPGPLTCNSSDKRAYLEGWAPFNPAPGHTPRPMIALHGQGPASSSETGWRRSLGCRMFQQDTPGFPLIFVLPTAARDMEGLGLGPGMMYGAEAREGLALHPGGHKTSGPAAPVSECLWK